MQKLSVVESDKINCFAMLSMFVQEHLVIMGWHDLLVYNKSFL